MEAHELTLKAEEASMRAHLRLEHPWVAHDLHERAASAWEKEGNQKQAANHRASAQYWAARETEKNKTK